MNHNTHTQNDMYFVINSDLVQVDESPFATREEAEEWVRKSGQRGVGQGFYFILSEEEYIRDVENGGDDDTVPISIS